MRKVLARWHRRGSSAAVMILFAATQLLFSSDAFAKELPNDTSRRYALIIGNADYKYITPLKNPANDADSLCKALRNLRFETDCRQNIPDRRSLREAVRDFSKRLRPDDVALFYFAGHGIEMEGENYLVPTAADIQARSYLEDEALRLGFVFDELRESRVRLSIVILDACRDNPFGKVRSASAGGLGIPAAQPAGSIIIFPTAPGKVAFDGSGGNGLFTTHLLRNVTEGGVTIEQMFKKVIEGVRRESARYGKEQIPWMNLSFTGEFCFDSCGLRAEEFQRMAADFQGQLAERQFELIAIRQRMKEMEARLSQQSQDVTLSGAQQTALARELQEHASKTQKLREQEGELARLTSELSAARREQVDLLQREAALNSAKQRIEDLERQLDMQERGFRGAAPEIERLRRERDALMRERETESKLHQQLAEARSRLQRLQSALATVERQQQELDQYKNQILRLEAESRGKDSTLAAVRAELGARERDLHAVRAQLTALQEQYLDKERESKMSAPTLARLARERDALVDSSKLIAERDRELKAVRDQLRVLESSTAKIVTSDVEEIRGRLAQYDRQQHELNSYKRRLAEAEQQLKDAAAAAVKGAAFVPPAL